MRVKYKLIHLRLNFKLYILKHRLENVKRIE